LVGWMGRREYGLMGGWVNGRMEGWLDRWKDI
jgi:hypothetical protein